MEPPSGGTETPPAPLPDRRRWVVIGSVMVIAVVVTVVSLPGLVVQPPGDVPPRFSGTVAPTTATPVPATPGRTVLPSPKGTIVPGTTPSPAATATTPAGTCIPSGPPGFTVTVSPVQASAARSETVNYQMTIEAQNCFSEEVSMKLTASVLFLSYTYDLGTQGPPYPKTFEYALTVPDSLFPGTTVNGILTSTGGGITRENQLALSVL